MSELSKNDIRKDFREIERTMPDDSDSDCSFKSDEILACTYPQKPRKTTKPAKAIFRDPSKSESVRERESQILLADHALNFVRAIRFSKKDFYEADVKRESLEIINDVCLIY